MFDSVNLLDRNCNSRVALESPAATRNRTVSDVTPLSRHRTRSSHGAEHFSQAIGLNRYTRYMLLRAGIARVDCLSLYSRAFALLLMLAAPGATPMHITP